MLAPAHSRTRIIRRLLLAGWSIVATAPAAGQAFTARVARVDDGRTVEVIAENDSKTRTVRLLALEIAGLPETASSRSRKNLAGWALNRTVTVEWFPSSPNLPSSPKNDLIVGRLWLGSTDLGLMQISTGFARHDREQLADEPTNERTLYTEAEQRAKDHHYGMWKTSGPDPWQTLATK